MAVSRTRTGPLLSAVLLVLAPLLGGAPVSAADTFQADETYWAFIAVTDHANTVTARQQTFQLFPNVWTDEIASFDVQVSRTPMTAPRQNAWQSPAELQGVRASEAGQRDRPFGRVTLDVGQGEVVCVSTRGHAFDGRVSPWTQASCVVRFLDDSRLVRTGPVKRLVDDRYWNGRATALHKGATLVLPRAPAGSRIAMLTSTVPLDGPAGLVIVAQRGRKHLFVSFEAGRAVDGKRHTSRVTVGGRVSSRPGPVRVRTTGSVSVAVQGLAVLPAWAGLSSFTPQ